MARAVLGFCLLLGLVALVRAEPPEGYPFLAYDDGLRAAQAQGRRVLVYFGRYGCGFCEKTNKEAFGDAGVRERYTAHYVLVYVDAESGKRLTLPSGERISEHDLGTRFKAFVTPVFVFLEPDGAPILQRAGIQSARDLLAYDDFVFGGRYKTQSLQQYLADRP